MGSPIQKETFSPLNIKCITKLEMQSDGENSFEAMLMEESIAVVSYQPTDNHKDKKSRTFKD